jgi:hypothetical protein
MRETYQLFFGLRLVSEEFHHSAIQTKIELHFGGFFHQMKVRQPGRYLEGEKAWSYKNRSLLQHKCDLYLSHSIRGRGRMKKACKYIEKKTQKITKKTNEVSPVEYERIPWHRWVLT